MQYNQPFDQPSNPNAPYVDGNPSAGIQGSIVPAASIEFPQRELMSVIAACGLVGTNADLAQLLESIKLVDVCNILKNSVNHGTQMNWVAQVPPLPGGTTFPIGTALWFNPGQPSVVGTTFSLNGSTPAPVTLSDHTPIQVRDVPSGYTWVLLFWDGTYWQALAGISRQPGQIVTLYANANWFVNAITGSDTLYDGTQPAIAGLHGPFQTIQRAVNETTKYNMNGYQQNIYVADLTSGANYGPVYCPQTNGSGTVNLIGNVNTPANVPIFTSQQFGCAILIVAGQYTVGGFRLSSGNNSLDGLAINGGTTAIVGQLQFGPCGRYHLCSAWSGNLKIVETNIIIEAGATASGHFAVEAATGGMDMPPLVPSMSTLDILGPVNIASFYSAVAAGNFEGVYSPITGLANVHGNKYLVSSNGIISTFGYGASSIPGDTAGTSSYGGQYVP